MTLKKTKPTESELEILVILWEKEKATVFQHVAKEYLIQFH